jgi:predicted outer membrane repeat protein
VNNTSTGTNSGGVRVDQNILTIFGSVIAGNVSGGTTGTNTDVDALQLVRNDGFNLIGVAPLGFSRGPGDVLGSPGKPVDPLLGGLPALPNPLPTTVIAAASQVRLPRQNSPLLGAGGAPEAARLATDQRNLPRPQLGNADIGPVEAQPGEVLPDAPPPPPPPPPPARLTATIDPQQDNEAAVNELVGLFIQANTNGNPFDEIDLFRRADGSPVTYLFDAVSEVFDGGTALPVFETQGQSVTINGFGATFRRPAGAPSFRFLRAVNGNLTLDDLTFVNGNVFDLEAVARGTVLPAVLSGGAVRVDGGNLTGTGLVFVGNTAAADGGAISLEPVPGGAAAGSLKLTGTTFLDNYAGNRGGAVFGNGGGAAASGLIEIVESVLDGNRSVDGTGGVQADTSTVRLARTVVSDNTGKIGGVSGRLVEAFDTLFKGNVATGSGPSAALANQNMLRLVRTTLTANKSAAGATAVGQSSGQAVELINTTVHANTGGASAILATADNGEVVASFSTITDNVSTAGTGVAVTSNVLTAYASVFSGNRVVTAAGEFTNTPADVQADIYRNNGFNFVSVAPANLPEAFRADPTNQVGTQLAPIDPRLGPLDGYGAASPVLVRLPAVNSPLRDRGGVPETSRLTEDARRFARVFGPAADVGAAELRSPSDPAVTPVPLPPFGPPVPPPPLPPLPPQTFVATIDPQADNAGAVAEIAGFFRAANGNTAAQDTIVLFPGGVYTFNTPDERQDGGTALPVIDSTIQTLFTLTGNGATFVRPAGAPSFRFVRIVGPTETALVAATGPTLTITGLTFLNGNVFDFQGANRLDPNAFVVLRGGAVRADNANLIVTDSKFVGNSATDDGGAVSFTAADKFVNTAAFERVEFADNSAGKAGGAVFAEQAGSLIRSDVNLVRVTATNNKALTGAGGVQANTVRVLLDTSRIEGNTGVTGGVSGELVNVVDTLVRGNTATGAGAGGVIATGNILRLTRSTVADNRSVGGGAVVGLSTGQAVELINSTVHGNVGGGAAVTAPLGQVVSSFSTVTNNRNTSGAGVAGVQVASSLFTVYATVVSGNRVVNADGSFTSLAADVDADLYRNNGFNFIGLVPSDFPAGPTDRVGRDGSEIDPLLGRLADNGGPVPTRLPAAGSPLLNAAGLPGADRLDTDARGRGRVSGAASDIGATEFSPGDTAPAAEPLPPRGPLPPPPPPPPAPARPPAAFAAGAGAAANPFVPLPTVAAPGSGARNQKDDGVVQDPSSVVPNTVILYNPNGTPRREVQPFAAAPPGGIRVATADLTGDGVPDVIAGTGPGVATQVVVIDGANGQVAFTLNPFEAAFTGGVFVAAGDLTGDGRPELIVTPDAGGGPRVRVFDGKTFAQLADFFGIDDPNFRGGARATVADITGDGVGDLVVAAGTGGGPRVAVFDGTSLSNGAFTRKPFGDFFAFEPGLRDGVFLAGGDVDADGRADLIVGAGPGGGPRVLVLSGRELGAESPRVIADFFAGDPADRKGVTVAAADLDGDSAADLVAGNNTTGRVTTYLGRRLAAADAAVEREVVPFGGFRGGVFVG